jgi:hypothetical protein
MCDPCKEGTFTGCVYCYLRSEHHLNGLLQPYQSWQPLSASETRDDAEAQLRQAQAGARCAHSGIAAHGDF